MKTDSTTIRAAMRNLWPGAALLWLPDEEYAVCDLDSLIRTAMASREIGGRKGDCNAVALQAYALCNRIDADGLAPAFGMAYGDRFRGTERSHTVNIAYCEDGIHLIDIADMLKRAWTGSHNDNLLTVIM
jgi:hypothetical protein